MHNELTNLLPYERQRALVREYFLRLSVVGVVLINILVCVAALLLLPTYVFLSRSMSAQKVHLAAIESALSSTNVSELSTRLSGLTRDAAILNALAEAPSASTVIRAMLAISHPGIALSGFSYTPATAQASSGTLAVSGSAITRTALRNYQLALEGAAFTLTATLPVSAYAKDSDIAFTITVLLAP